MLEKSMRLQMWLKPNKLHNCNVAKISKEGT